MSKRKLKLDEKRLDELFPPILILILGYVITVVYFAINGEKLITSDFSSDLVLANLLNREGGLLSTNWYYSTEIIFLDTQFIFKPALAIFPDNWHYARTLAVAIMMAIYLGSLGWFIKTSKIGPKGLWAVAFCSLPMGSDYLYNVTRSTCYIPNFVFSFAMIGVLLLALQKNNRVVLYTILLSVISFLSGLRTMRTILQVNIPLVAIAVFMLLCRLLSKYIDIHPSRIRKIDKKLLYYSVVMFVSALIGYAVNVMVLIKHYYYTNFDSSVLEAFSLNNVISVLGDIIAVFGWHRNVETMSAEGVSSCLSAVLGIAVCLSIVLLFFKHSEKLSDSEYIIVSYTLATIAICTFIFAHSREYVSRYWVHIIPFGYIALAIAIKHLAVKMPFLDLKRYALTFGLLVTACCYSWIIMPWDDTVDHFSMNEVVDWVEEQGYTEGISTFWQGNIAIELSDGKIDMWTICNFDQLSISRWLQVKSHEQFPEGRVFLLLTNDEYDLFADDMEDYVVYRQGDYVVFGFEEGVDYHSIITGAYSGNR